MLAFIICCLGVFGLLVCGEVLRHYKVFKSEGLRKFVHMSVGIFIAFWPWLLSWRQIQLLGLAMLVVVLANRYHRVFHFSHGIGREGYGDVFLAIAVTACAALTNVKVFFATAILQLAIADGMAAVFGSKFGKDWRYQVFNQTKTVIGSMAFWLAAAIILFIGLILGIHNFIDFQSYAILLIALPPVLTLVENISGRGLDNLSIPLVTLLALHIAQMA